MRICLDTPIQKLAVDLFEVVRIFYGNIPCEIVVSCENLPGDGLYLKHSLDTRDGKWCCGFDFQGKHGYLEEGIPLDKDPAHEALLQKRHMKRLCKQALYNLLKEITGMKPPWGGLTGIRPTRLLYQMLADGMPLDEGEIELQNIFDVQSKKAALVKEIVKVQQKLPLPDEKQGDVYIGIPFCTTRCTYCSFLSGELGDGALVPPYLDKLILEMEATAQLMQEKGIALRAVYMGGGTPTSLRAAQLETVLAAMNRIFPGAREVTVEAGRPDTITKEKLLAIQNAGVTRISINPQTMRDETLQRIGRNHTAKDVYDAYALARKVGFQHINMDVIAGLPGEIIADFAYTMEGAKALQPESLTVHTLAIKRSSRMHTKEFVLPDGAITAEMVRMGEETARHLGMEPYYLYRQKHMAGNQENVGYALPNHACLYNVDIMEETTHIFAVGAGGISKRIVGNDGKIVRAPNVSDIVHYIDRVDEMIARKKAVWQV